MNAQTLTLDAGSHLRAAANSGVARVKRSYVAPAPARGTSASNDAAFESGRDRAAELDGWARRAAAASGFGDAGMDVTTSRPGLDSGFDGSEILSVSDDFALPARASIGFAPGDSPLLHKTAGMRDLAVDISQWVRHLARRHVDAWRQRRLAWATYTSLRGLDARTLRDIGLDRSELRSVSAEIAGEADRERMQALRTLRALSLF